MDSTSWVITTDGKLFGCGANSSGQQGDGTTTNVGTFTQRLSGETISSVGNGVNATWVVTTDGKLYGCGNNANGNQGDGTTTDVLTFTQRTVPLNGVNIPIAIQPLNVPLNNPHLNPAPTLLLNSVSPANIVGTDYTFHAGGTGWLLCTVSVGQDQYALALFSSDLQSPLLWDEDTALMFSNGTMTAENGGSTYTMTYTDIYFEGNGEYVLTTGAANVLSDTQIIGFSIPSPGDAVQVTGVLGNLTAAMLGGSSTVGTVTATAEDTDYDEVKNITAISVAYNSDSAVCSSLIAPKKVTVTETVENTTMKAILSIVPLVMIVGLMLAIIGTVLYKRL